MSSTKSTVDQAAVMRVAAPDHRGQEEQPNSQAVPVSGAFCLSNMQSCVLPIDSDPTVRIQTVQILEKKNISRKTLRRWIAECGTEIESVEKQHAPPRPPIKRKYTTADEELVCAIIDMHDGDVTERMLSRETNIPKTSIRRILQRVREREKRALNEMVPLPNHIFPSADVMGGPVALLAAPPIQLEQAIPVGMGPPLLLPFHGSHVLPSGHSPEQSYSISVEPSIMAPTTRVYYNVDGQQGLYEEPEDPFCGLAGKQSKGYFSELSEKAKPGTGTRGNDGYESV